MPFGLPENNLSTNFMTIEHNAFGHNGETNKQTHLETGQINYWPRSSQLLPMVGSLSKNCPLTHGFQYGQRAEKAVIFASSKWTSNNGGVWGSCN